MLKNSTKRILRQANFLLKVNQQYTTTTPRFLAAAAAPSVAFKQQKQQKPDWNRAILEAERIVGYPTSFLSLRWLLSDEITNVALHLRRLIGSRHPFLQTAKQLLYSSKNNMHALGLIVLLVSKSAGYNDTVPDLQQDKNAGILHSQRALAEVTEMIRTAQLIHKSLVNLQYTLDRDESELVFGNKIALLSGDYLLANCCAELANLRQQDVVELISSALRDQSESDLVGRRDLQNNPLPSPPVKQLDRNSASECLINYDVNNLNPAPAMDNCTVEEEWSLRHILSPGSLLGKSIQGAIYLAGHDSQVQKQGYLFGKHLALAWQASVDMEPFLVDDMDVTKMSQMTSNGQQPFSLVSAPVLFALQTDPGMYELIESGSKSVFDINYKAVWSRVKQGSAIDITRALQVKHTDAALDILDNFPASEARNALANIIAAIQH